LIPSLRTGRRAGLGGCLAALLCLPVPAAWYPLGPFGGSASIVVADPHSPGTFLAATSNALLFRTSNAGDSWTPVAFPFQLQANLNALVIDPQMRGVYLAGFSSALPAYSGLLRTTDAGATWHQIPDLRGQQVRALVFKRLNSKLVAAGTDDGAFLSHDGGLTWNRVSPADNPQLRPVVSVAFDPKNGSMLYAGTPHLPWLTSDGGASWRSIPAGMIDDSDIFSIQVDRNRPDRIFAAACSGIYRSLNRGVAWKALAGPKDVSSRTYTVVQDPQYENVWFAGTANGVLGSRDSGESWQLLASVPARSIAFDPRRLGRILIATEEDGILRSEDSGRTWKPANHGFCNRPLASRPATPEPVVTLGGRLLRGTEAGLRVSNDRGATWQVARGELESDSIQALNRHPRRPAQVFASKFGGVYTSSDGGQSWRRISPASWPIHSVRQMAVQSGSPDRLLVLTQQQGVWVLELEPPRP
jgi:photosystem II stability/assembly factor-like uncharacterized protein